MTAVVRGAHHSVGIATAVTEMVFRHLRSVCEMEGGTLSLAELDKAQSQAMRSFAGAMAFFEAAHQRCMEASGATAPEPFSQENILGSLLMACGQKAARPAFTMQINRFGEVWLSQFFGGVAHYVRQSACTTADDRLRQIYATMAAQLGAGLTVGDLLRAEDTRRVLMECTAPLVAASAVETIAAPLSDAASQYIAARRGIPKPDLSKVTDQEMRKFLSWLPPQMQLALTANSARA